MQPSRRRPLLAAALTAALLTLPASAAHAAGGGAVPAFDAHRTLALGAGITDPRALVTGDLDGDGRPDLVAGSANGGTGAVSVLRGTGAGAFAAPLSSPYGLGTPGGVGALALGDVNGDGHPDVVATIGSGTADDDQLVPLAGDGTGALTAGTPTTITGTELAGIALADLDGDGDLDALTASTTATTADQLGIVENGGVAGLVMSSATGATGTQLATGVAAGDLDGDGTPDALVISRNAGTGSAWVATGHALGLTATGTPVTVGADPVAVTLADVDGDGDLDGLVLDGSAPQLTLLRNDGAGGLTATDDPGHRPARRDRHRDRRPQRRRRARPRRHRRGQRHGRRPGRRRHRRLRRPVLERDRRRHPRARRRRPDRRRPARRRDRRQRRRRAQPAQERRDRRAVRRALQRVRDRDRRPDRRRPRPSRSPTPAPPRRCV